jgi:voltage-gated potassium channel Kch
MRQQTTENSFTLKQRIVAFVRSTTLYARAFFVIALAFFFFGLFSIGSLNGTGKSLKVPGGKTITIAYDILEKNTAISGVYVNVGSVYAEAGGDELAETMRLSAYYLDTDGDFTSWGSSAYVANIYYGGSSTSTSYKSNANYNWISLATTSQTTSLVQIKITASTKSPGGEINEVVFLNADGKAVKAKFNYAHSSGVLKAGETSTDGQYSIREEDVAATLDAQGSYHDSTSRRYNFTQNEEYILESISGIGQGSETLSSGTYTISEDYNAFGILVYWFFTRIFGMSTFGLRLPSFLAMFGTFVLLYFFGKKLFKGEKWGLLCSVVFGIGGMFFSVGSLGTPAALALLAVVGSVYCMYFFYAKGIDGKHPIKSALPIVYSGLCFGAALAVNTVAGIACSLSLVVFLFGLLRLYRSYRYQNYRLQRDLLVAKSAAAAAAEESEAITAENKETTETAEGEITETTTVTTTTKAKAKTAKEETEAEKALKADYSYRLRVAIGLFVAAFIAFPVILLALSGLPTYTSFVRHYVSEYSDEANYYLWVLQKGLSQCFAIGDITPYTAKIASSPWGWFIAWQGATLFGSAAATSSETGSLFNVQTNLLASVAAALCFIGLTVYVIAGGALSAKGEMADGKRFKNVLRGYVGILVGAAASLIPYLFIENVSALQSVIFSCFYLLSVPLLFYAIEPKREGKKKVLAKIDVLMIVVLALLVINFVMAMPASFGWETGVTASKALYNWNAFFSNGYYGIIKFN